MVSRLEHHKNVIVSKSLLKVTRSGNIDIFLVLQSGNIDIYLVLQSGNIDTFVVLQSGNIDAYLGMHSTRKSSLEADLKLKEGSNRILTIFIEIMDPKLSDNAQNILVSRIC